ncbi:MAG: D-alanyl-D-alanine carboxypeptidase, partial [Clostridia bacterium]|nr:D-alanyl-D-alanine carboxypeptidase [Clostridia bacterium]
MRRVVCCVVAVVLLCALAPPVSAQRALPDVSVKCACVVERRTGRLIAGKNEHQRASMASTTKIMTALLLC